MTREEKLKTSRKELERLEKKLNKQSSNQSAKEPDIVIKPNRLGGNRWR